MDTREPDLSGLQAELEFYRQNQTTVEQEIRMVIGDNQRLSQQVKALLQERLDCARKDNQGLGKSDDLRVQLTLITKERDSLHMLWTTSQKTIDALENELKTYQSYDNGEELHSKEDRKDLELKLETSLTDYLELETKYKELSNKHSSLQNELKHKEEEIISYKERGKELEEQLDDKKKTLEEFRINLEAEKKCNEELKTQLHLCQRESVDSIKNLAEAKSKVAEALQLYDVVSAQKSEAYRMITEVTEELMQSQKSLETIKQETEISFRSEVDETRQRYNERMADMLQHIRHLDNELVEKGVMLNKALREVKVLQEVNENLMKERDDSTKAVEPKLALAEQKLETIFQELVCSERRNILMVSEKQSLAIDVQRIQDTHARELKRRDWEENMLKTQCEELKVQVAHLQRSLEDTHGMVDKLQSMLASSSDLTNKMLVTKDEELLELNNHLEKQMDLSKKWKESYVEMAEKLKKKLEDLHAENKELRERHQCPCSESGLDETSS